VLFGVLASFWNTGCDDDEPMPFTLYVHNTGHVERRRRHGRFEACQLIKIVHRYFVHVLLLVHGSMKRPADADLASSPKIEATQVRTFDALPYSSA